MTQKYIGVKMVTAYPQEKDGREGYAVVYEDGYTSWSPKDVFEKFYYPMGFLNLEGCEGAAGENDSRITQEMVNGFLQTGSVENVRLGAKTCVTQVETITGMELTNHAACVDPANYDEAGGEKIAMKKIMDEVWFGLGFVLQWAKNGLKR
jgi:hypothetical protein